MATYQKVFAWCWTAEDVFFFWKRALTKAYSNFNSKSQFFKIQFQKSNLQKLQFQDLKGQRLSKSPSQNWLFCFKLHTRGFKSWSKIALLMEIWLVSVLKLENCWFCWVFVKNIKGFQSKLLSSLRFSMLLTRFVLFSLDFHNCWGLTCKIAKDSLKMPHRNMASNWT